jgi:FkbM family methyltransferase
MTTGLEIFGFRLLLFLIRNIRRNMFKPGILSWISPKTAKFIYTVACRPLILKRIVGFCIKKLVPPELFIRGVHLSLNQNDPIVSGNLFLGCYETNDIEFFVSILKADMNFVDIGANIGLYSSIASKIVRSDKKVIAIEPERYNCSLIRKTKERNCLHNLIIEEKAAGNIRGRSELFINPMNPADHRLHDQSEARIATPVVIDLADNIINENGLVSVDLIKMDVQGFEAKVWAGLGATLQANPNIKILMELWPWGLNSAGTCPRDFLKTIRSQGFTIYEITDTSNKPVLRNFDDYLLSFRKEREHLNLFLFRD